MVLNLKASLGMLALAGALTVFAGGNCPTWEERAAKKATQYRKYAKHNLGAKVSECEKKAPEEIQKLSEEIVNKRKKMGNLLNDIADAYEKKDKKAVRKLSEQQDDMERSIRLLETKKHIEYRLSDIKHALKEYPDSKGLQDANTKIQSAADSFLATCTKLNNLEKQKRTQEKSLDNLLRDVDILKQEAKLEKMKRERDNE